MSRRGEKRRPLGEGQAQNLPFAFLEKSEHPRSESRNFARRIKRTFNDVFKRLLRLWLACLATQTQAQTVDERDFVSWTTAIVTIRLDDAPYSFQAFAQARLTQNASRFQAAVFNVFGFYRVAQPVSVGLGYTIQTPINDRILDIVALQLAVEGKIKSAPFSVRFRAEKLTWRSKEDFFVEIISAPRFRLRPEIAVPIWENYFLLLNDEIFWNAKAPILNQNRAQIGIRRRESTFTIDALYQHRFINRVARLPDRIEHTLLLNFIWAINI